MKIIALILLFAVVSSSQTFLEKMNLNVETVEGPNSVTQPFDPELGQELMAFAFASYCPTKKIEKWKCGEPCRRFPGMTDVQVLTDGVYHDNHAFVGFHTGLSAIIIAWKGSISLQNWLSDFNFLKVKYPYCDGCEVHEGFFKAYNAMQDSFWRSFQTVQSLHPGAKIMLTGHSLGAALSVLNAADMTSRGVKNFTWYNYGCPRVGNDSLSLWVQNQIQQSMYRVTHHKDPVPHLPPVDFGFHHMATEVFYEKKSKPNDKHIICNGSGEDPDCSDKYLADLDVVDHLEYMGYNLGVLVPECDV